VALAPGTSIWVKVLLLWRKLCEPGVKASALARVLAASTPPANTRRPRRLDSLSKGSGRRGGETASARAFQRVRVRLTQRLLGGFPL
jgi:hypothetical protein